MPRSPPTLPHQDFLQADNDLHSSQTRLCSSPKQSALKNICTARHLSALWLFQPLQIETMISSNCEHAFKMVKSDNPLIHWICNLCHSGPHWFIFECHRCELRTCRPCSSKALGARSNDRQDDEGASEQPRQHPASPDHGAHQACSEASQERSQATGEQTKQHLTVPIRTARNEADACSATASGDHDDTKFGELLPSVLIDAKESLVDGLMENFDDLLQELTYPPPMGCIPRDIMEESPAARACTASSSSSTSSGSLQDSMSSLQASGSHLNGGVKKRKKERSSTNGDEKDSEDDGEEQRMTSPAASTIKDVPRKLACPFAKRYTGRTPRFPVCAYPGWATTHRVKEHLYRRHVRRVVIECPRCCEEFESVILLEQHVRKAERCVERVRPPREEGLDCNQERYLKCRKRIINTSEEEKWKRVYQICFPDVPEADIPSPCTSHTPVPFLSHHQVPQKENSVAGLLPTDLPL